MSATFQNFPLALLAMLLGLLAVLDGRPPIDGGELPRVPLGAGQESDAILQDPTRPSEERDRDAGSKPLQVYSWLGVDAGSVVVDLIPYFGYNTHLLSRLVGPRGRVHAVGSAGEAHTALTRRIATAGLGNAEVHQLPSTVADGTADVVISIRNVHDMFIPAMVEQYGMPREVIFAEIRRMLKPGGIFGVVDARTPRAGVDAENHRINQDLVIAELEAAGFELIDSSDMLAVSDDDAGSWGTNRSAIDRFLLKFRKRR